MLFRSLGMGAESGYMRIKIQVTTHCILERRQRTCRQLLRWSKLCQVQLARVLSGEFSLQHLRKNSTIQARTHRSEVVVRVLLTILKDEDLEQLRVIVSASDFAAKQKEIFLL